MFSYSYSPSERITKNVLEISNFPNEENAQLKANNYGTLGRADGTTWAANWFATKAGLATELTGTIEAIEVTFKAIADKVAQDIAVLKEKGMSLSSIEELKDDFTNELSMLEGLKNIQAVYTKRYEKVEAKMGSLANLNAIYLNYQNIINQHGTYFSELLKDYDQRKLAGEVPFDLSQSIVSPKASATYTLEETMSRLDAYLSKWSPQISPSQAREEIQQGRELLKGILRGDITDPKQTPMGSEKAVNSLMWFLMSLALEKKQGHSEGSFALEDEGGRIYNFLMKATGCSSRESSHYVDRSPYWSGATKLLMKSSWHQGIDVTSANLPAGKRHVLFGQVEPFSKEGKDKLLFIKLEGFSPFASTGYGYDMTMHGVELALAQYNKKFHPGSDDHPDMAKERVPTEILKEFKKIVDTFKDTIFLVKEKLAEKGYKEEPEKAARIYGIAYMTDFVQIANELPIQPFDYDPKEFEKVLPLLDHMDKRTGREVYLSKEELSNI